MNYKSLLKGRHVVVIAALICFVMMFSPMSTLGQNCSPSAKVGQFRVLG